MKNKLISDEKREEYKLLYGYSFPEERRSGRSTGLALRFIGEAMSNPGKKVELYDHHHKGSYFFMIDLIKSILNKLELLHFEILREDTRSYLIYSIF